MLINYINTFKKDLDSDLFNYYSKIDPMEIDLKFPFQIQLIRELKKLNLLLKQSNNTNSSKNNSSKS